MSVWTAMSAGLQIVQDKLDQALGEESNEQTESGDPSGSDNVVPNQSDIVFPSTSKESLQKALKDSEQQNHLINLEFSRLLREKEEELNRLREQAELPKDVLELQRQLTEKDQQLQELSLKAETKFNKLKSQAKAKIATLTEELEKVKGKFPINQESFDTSIDSIAADQGSIKEQLLLKTEECSQLKQQLEKRERDWNDKINAEQHSAQRKLQDAAATHKVEKSKLFETIDKLQLELSSSRKKLTEAISSYDEQKKLFEKETAEKAKLNQQVVELISKLEESEKRITRDFSFASSEFQVVSSQVSQADSEEEWKVICASGSSSEGKECSPPPEMVSTITQDLEFQRQKKPKKVLPLRATPELVKSFQNPTVQHLENQLFVKEKEIQSLKEQLEKTVASEDLHTSESPEPITTVTKLTEENEQLCSQLYSVREVVSEMEEELAEKSSVVEKLCKQIKQLEAKLSEINEVISSNEQTIKMLELEKAEKTKTLQEECDHLRSQLTGKKMALNGELVYLKKVIEEKDNEIERIVQEGMKKTEEIAQLTNQLEVLQVNTKRELALVREQSLQEVTAKQELKMEEKEEQHKQLLHELEVSSSNQIDLMQSELSIKDNEIIQLKVQTSEELGKLESELNSAMQRLEELEMLRGNERLEREQLQGEMNRLTESSMAFSADSAKCRENILVLEEQLSSFKKEKEHSSERLESALKSENLALKQLEEVKTINDTISSELERYRYETGRMNNQFSSAVELLKQENQKLQSDLSMSTNDKKQLKEMNETLKEQIAAEGDRSVLLNEDNRQLKSELKTLNTKLVTLEGDKHTLLQRVSELAAIQNQLQMSLETSVKEKESFDREHEITLRNSQSSENKVMELTNEIVTLVREKEAGDNTMRQLQRSIASYMKEKEDMRIKIESLQNQSVIHDDWQKEKEDLVNHLALVEKELSISHQDKDKYQTQIAQMKSIISSLEGDCTSLKNALSTSEMEKCICDNDTRSISELETMLSELRQSHITERTKLQLLVDTERTAKLEALQQYEELQRQSMDYVINIEDTATSNDRTSLETAGDWIHRFIRKPNIVVMRLMRATPQTILLFLAYFIAIHLLLLYMIFS